MDIPPNGEVVNPVACFNRLLIQPNIFWPMTENSSIIRHVTPVKSSCNLDNADEVKGPFLFPRIGNCKRECKVLPLILKAAIPK